jgi:hypothetical protein
MRQVIFRFENVLLKLCNADGERAGSGGEWMVAYERKASISA